MNIGFFANYLFATTNTGDESYIDTRDRTSTNHAKIAITNTYEGMQGRVM